jgi:DNA polymerase-3 subunit alpha
MCNTHCSEVDDKEALSKKEEITIGGIVTGTKSKFTKTGKPCGFVTIEDFEGTGELAFFGEEWGKWQGMLTEGCTVFITAKCVQKYRDSNFYDLRVSDIQYLQTVKENRIEKFTIIADSDAIDDTVVNDIISMVGGKSGKTQLYFQIRDTKTNNTVLLRSTNKTINLSYDLVSYIEENPNMRYHVN